MAMEPSCVAPVSAKAPPKVPMGVRTAPAMTTSFIAGLLSGTAIIAYLALTSVDDAVEGSGGVAIVALTVVQHQKGTVAVDDDVDWVLEAGREWLYCGAWTT